MVKKIFSGLILSSLLITSCIKSDTKCSFNDSNTIAPASEIKSLKDSLDSAGITASQHPSGFFYKISGNGTGAGINNLCSNLTVTYKGSFFKFLKRILKSDEIKIKKTPDETSKPWTIL